MCKALQPSWPPWQREGSCMALGLQLSSITLIIKWSKTIHNRRNVVTPPLPYLGSSILCPIAALNKMIAMYPASQNYPLLILPRNTYQIPLIDSIARKHLKSVSNILTYPTFDIPCLQESWSVLGFPEWSPSRIYPKKHGLVPWVLCVFFYFSCLLATVNLTTTGLNL